MWPGRPPRHRAPTHNPLITLTVVMAYIEHRHQPVVAEALREFWIHKPTGHAWAVEVRDGVVLAAAGPLDAAEAHPIILDYLDYSRHEASWITKNRNDFVRIEGD